jgi:hypothetical protein
MGVPPTKLHEKPAEANKSGTEGEQKAGFFDPVTPRKQLDRVEKPRPSGGWQAKACPTFGLDFS